MSSEAGRIIDLYQRKALEWVRDRERPGGLMEQSWLDRFLALVSSNGSILDIGCGSAVPISRYLIEAGHSVTGIDSSATLIDLCRDRFPAHEWLVADMRRLALGRSFNGILAWDSFFHLCPDDQRQMFPLFQQHAAPGAPLMFTSGPAHGVAIGDFEGEPLYHASLDPAEYRSLLDQHGFRVIAHAAEDMNCGRHTIWLAQRV
jgi:trans-aconitate methyltransferase